LVNPRRSYPLFILLNGRVYNEVRIDPHYELKHIDYMSDELILKLVKTMNRERYRPQSESHGWSYFEVDRFYDGKWFRVVFCTHEHKNYLGIINCYRRRK